MSSVIIIALVTLKIKILSIKNLYLFSSNYYKNSQFAKGAILFGGVYQN